jgi:signal transduction histidine kinase
LAAGIAHEINTPTQYVGDNIGFLKESWGSVAEFLSFCGTVRSECSPGPVPPEHLLQFCRLHDKCDLEFMLKEIPDAIDQSLEGVQRVAKIVKGFKEFSHPGSEEKRAINLNQAIETTITVARHVWKYCAEVVTEFDAALPLVPCLVGEFNQVMLNLIINSAHAISDVIDEHGTGKGTITIGTRQEGPWATISVADTGAGIPPEIQSRVFEPFFTTKEVGQGTGQGLALAHVVIVKRHQGQLSFESKVGVGTTFFVRLPLEVGTPA